jgi:hypothetical protein
MLYRPVLLLSDMVTDRPLKAGQGCEAGVCELLRDVVRELPIGELIFQRSVSDWQSSKLLTSVCTAKSRNGSGASRRSELTRTRSGDVAGEV